MIIVLGNPHSALPSLRTYILSKSRTDPTSCAFDSASSTTTYARKVNTSSSNVEFFFCRARRASFSDSSWRRRNVTSCPKVAIILQRLSVNPGVDGSGAGSERLGCDSRVASVRRLLDGGREEWVLCEVASDGCLRLRTAAISQCANSTAHKRHSPSFRRWLLL